LAYDMYIYSETGVPKWVTSEDGTLLGASGPAVLAGLVLRVMMTQQGTMPTARAEGTNLPRIIGAPVDVGHVEGVLVAAVQSTETYIRNLQSKHPYPSDETLKRLSIYELSTSDNVSLQASILIENQAGARFTTTITLGD